MTPRKFVSEGVLAIEEGAPRRYRCGTSGRLEGGGGGEGDGCGDATLTTAQVMQIATTALSLVPLTPGSRSAPLIVCAAGAGLVSVRLRL